jgi:hypothetical protein
VAGGASSASSLTDIPSSRQLAGAAYCVIDSRGSGEALGDVGRPAAVFVRVFRHLVAPARVEVVSNPYPARGGWPRLIAAGMKLPIGYRPSVVAGKDWLSAAIARPPSTCAGAKLILTGYSQGAQAAADVFQNGGTRNVLALVLFGDPYFNGSDAHADKPNAEVPYSRGRRGALGRRPPFASSSYGHVFSFCHGGDPVCQITSNLVAWTTWHTNYDKLGEPARAANAIAKLIGGLRPSEPATFPPGTRDLGFRSKDGNVGCWIQRDASLAKYSKPAVLTARCVVHERSWSPKWPDCHDISEIEYFYVTQRAAKGTHEYGCTGGVPWNLDSSGTADPWHAQPLYPGQSIDAAGFHCTATSAAEIRCTNASVHGFFVSRARFQLL